MKTRWMLFAVMAAAGWSQAAIQPLEGTNVVGFKAVSAPGGANSLITVPFEACLGEGSPGMLDDLVSTYSLTSHSSDPASADQLVVLTTSGGEQVYYYYYNDTEDGWTPITSAQLMPDGTEKTLSPPAAGAFAVARGLGFWIKRVASANSSVYVQGQVAAAKQATPIAEGLNLIGYAALASFNVNDLDWTGANGSGGIGATTDRLMVGNGDGTYTTYHYYVKKAGGAAYYDTFDNKWVVSTPTGPALPSAPVAAGQGFWYHRRGTGSFTLRPDGQ